MARFGAGGPSAGFGSRSTGSSSRGSSSRGSSLGDGGGRAANNGGMSGGSRRSSSGGGTSTGLGDGGGRAANNGGMSAITGSSASSTSNQASPGRSTPGSPSAADGRRGASMGPTGGSAGPSTPSSNPGRPGGEANERSFVNTSTSGGSDSIRGSSDARRVYAFDSGKIRDAVVRNREARDSPMGLIQEGMIIPPTDLQPKPDYIRAETQAYDAYAKEAERAGNDNPFVDGAIGAIFGPLGNLVKDAMENNAAGKRAAKQINAIMAENDIAEGALVADPKALADGITRQQTPIIGGDGSLVSALTGRLDTVDNSETGGKGNIQQPVTPPAPMSPQQAADSGSQFGAGEVNGYASYARRVFSIL